MEFPERWMLSRPLPDDEAYLLAAMPVRRFSRRRNGHVAGDYSRPRESGIRYLASKWMNLEFVLA